MPWNTYYGWSREPYALETHKGRWFVKKTSLNSIIARIACIQWIECNECLLRQKESSRSFLGMIYDNPVEKKGGGGGRRSGEAPERFEKNIPLWNLIYRLWRQTCLVWARYEPRSRIEVHAVAGASSDCIFAHPLKDTKGYKNKVGRLIKELLSLDARLSFTNYLWLVENS